MLASEEVPVLLYALLTFVDVGSLICASRQMRDRWLQLKPKPTYGLVEGYVDREAKCREYFFAYTMYLVFGCKACSLQPRRRHAVSSGRVALPSLRATDKPYEVNISSDTNKMDLIVSAFTTDGEMCIYRVARTPSSSPIGAGCSFKDVAQLLRVFGRHQLYGINTCVGHRGMCIDGRFVLLHGLHLKYTQLHLLDLQHDRVHTYPGTYGQDAFTTECISLRDGTICRVQFAIGTVEPYDPYFIFFHQSTAHLPALLTEPLALCVYTNDQMLTKADPRHPEEILASRVSIVEYGYHKALVFFFTSYPAACVLYDTVKPWEMRPIHLLVSPEATYAFLPGRVTGSYGPDGEVRVTRDSNGQYTAINVPHWKGAMHQVAAVRIDCDYTMPEEGWIVN